MENYGFKVIDAVRIPNYAGSIRVIATLNHKIKSKPSVNRILWKKKEVSIVKKNTKIC